MSPPEIRTATREDFEHFLDGPLRFSARGIVAFLDGKPVAIAGLAFRNGIVAAFCDIGPEMRQFRHLIHRRAIRLVSDAVATHRVVHAQMDMCEPTAPKWLRRLGFRPIDEGARLWRVSRQ